MNHDELPTIESGATIHVNYQMGGDSVVPMSGMVTSCNATFVAIHHTEKSNFITSFLWWDRVVSLHILREKGEAP